MSEYIITDRQLGLIQDFANVCVEGEKLTRIVRCRDCKHYHEAGIASYTPFCEWMNDSDVTPDGFCAWGEQKSEVE